MNETEAKPPERWAREYEQDVRDTIKVSYPIPKRRRHRGNQGKRFPDTWSGYQPYFPQAPW